VGKPDLFFIIDAHAQIHRSYHTPMRPLSGPVGSCPDCYGTACEVESGPHLDVSACPTCRGTGREPTTCVYQFLEMLKHIAERRQPAYLAVCFDSNRMTLRRRSICPEYKAHRTKPQPDLTCQMLRVRELCKLLGLASFELEGYEADDLIATLARKCASDDVHVRIVSKDKDMACLLADPRVLLYDAKDNVEVGPEWVERRFKVKPEQMSDYLTLVGDVSDGISGVAGIGEVGAVKLLRAHGSIQNILIGDLFKAETQATCKKLWAAVRDKSLDKARKLVALDNDAPIKVRPSRLEFNGLNYRDAAPMLRALGFKQWSK
jgi:5'-3' exonuclease